MNSVQPNNLLIIGGLALAVGVFLILLFVNAPYGRHLHQGWGPLIPNLFGWVIMESPAVLVFGASFLFGSAAKNLPILLFFILWELHYVYRAFIYPFSIRDGQKKMPFVVILMGSGFNLVNAYANGHYLFSISSVYPQEWLRDPRFVIGLFLFLAGSIVNHWADLTLRKLRKPGETGYRIPYGGFFRWVSCPNYLGEIIEWLGWAVMTWSLVGLVFAVWTFANLAPRARSHHTWYHAMFTEYPTERKALIPWIW